MSSKDWCKKCIAKYLDANEIRWLKKNGGRWPTVGLLADYCNQKVCPVCPICKNRE